MGRQRCCCSPLGERLVSSRQLVQEVVTTCGFLLLCKTYGFEGGRKLAAFRPMTSICLQGDHQQTCDQEVHDHPDSAATVDSTAANRPIGPASRQRLGHWLLRARSAAAARESPGGGGPHPHRKALREEWPSLQPDAQKVPGESAGPLLLRSIWSVGEDDDPGTEGPVLDQLQRLHFASLWEVTLALQEGRRSQSDIWRQGPASSQDQGGWVQEASTIGRARPFQRETVRSRLER